MAKSGKQRVLITGASSGIGYACAEALLQAGHRVVGTSRADRSGPDGVEMVALDVSDKASVEEGVRQALEVMGGIDVLINNAGFGLAGAVEDTDEEEALRQFDVNFFGVHRMCRAVLPTLRGQGGGRIVNIGSIGGTIALPFQAFYSASKFALEGFSDALRMEVAPFGIQVVLIAPGDIRSGFTAARRHSTAGEAGDYRAMCERALGVAIGDEEKGADVSCVADQVVKVVAASRPAERYVVGHPFQKLASVLRRLLPRRLFTWLLSAYYRVGRV